MNQVKKTFWVASGILLVFVQSFFILRWPVLIWASLFSWVEKEPWWLILLIGVLDGLFKVESLVLNTLFYLGAALAVKGLRTVLGMGGGSKVRANGFH